MEIRRELLNGFNGGISERQSKKYGEMRNKVLTSLVREARADQIRTNHASHQR